MTKKPEKLSTVLKYFSAILLSSAIFGCGLLYDLAQKDDFDRVFSTFVLVSMIIHTFVGLAILSQKKWGLFVFKFYLYILFLAIPVGTYISYKTLQYMEQNKNDSFERNKFPGKFR